MSRPALALLIALSPWGAFADDALTDVQKPGVARVRRSEVLFTEPELEQLLSMHQQLVELEASRPSMVLPAMLSIVGTVGQAAAIYAATQGPPAPALFIGFGFAIPLVIGIVSFVLTGRRTFEVERKLKVIRTDPLMLRIFPSWPETR